MVCFDRMEKMPKKEETSKRPRGRDGERPMNSTGDGASAPAATPGSDDATSSRLLPLAWPLFTAMWLLFPIGFVVEILRSDLTTARLLAFLIPMAAYVAVFLWLMLRYRFRAPWSSPEHRVKIGLLTALAILALYLELAYGNGIPYYFMFVVIAAAVTLGTRQAAWTVFAIVLLVIGIHALRSGLGAVAASWQRAVAPFVIVGFSMILVSRLVVTVRELQAARAEIARLAVAEERLRFARDLHDLLGHSLSLITLKSTLAGRLLPATPETEGAANEVRDVEEVARGALREIREAVAGYRRPTLDAELAGARDMLDAAEITCHVERAASDLPPQTDSVLAWAVREGVTNVIRHSQARHCEIRVYQTDGEIRVEISDDGIGSSLTSNDTNGVPVASGLSGLAERVAASGGDFEAGPLVGEGNGSGGFRVRIGLPLRNGTADPADASDVAADGAQAKGEAVGNADSEASGKPR